MLDLIPEIIETCRACRLWQRAGPRPIASLALAKVFNEGIQCDLLFYETYIVFHIIDKCIRWHAGREVPNKEVETLLLALVEIWFQI